MLHPRHFSCLTLVSPCSGLLEASSSISDSRKTGWVSPSTVTLEFQLPVKYYETPRPNSGSWRWIGRPGMLQSMESQSQESDTTERLNWTEGQRSCSKVTENSLSVVELRGSVRDTPARDSWPTFPPGFMAPSSQRQKLRDQELRPGGPSYPRSQKPRPPPYPPSL